MSLRRKCLYYVLCAFSGIHGGDGTPGGVDDVLLLAGGVVFNNGILLAGSTTSYIKMAG